VHQRSFRTAAGWSAAPPVVMDPGSRYARPGRDYGSPLSPLPRGAGAGTTGGGMLASFGQNRSWVRLAKCATLSCPHAGEHRRATRVQIPSAAEPRCDASRSMRAQPTGSSSSFETRARKFAFAQRFWHALLRMRTRSVAPFFTMSNSPSRSRDAVLRPGFASLLRPPSLKLRRASDHGRQSPGGGGRSPE